MSKHIDYLTQYGNNTDNDPAFPICGQFTVDKAQKFVVAEYEAGMTLEQFFVKDGIGNDGFQVHDNFEILAVGFSLPIGFDIYSPNALITIGFLDSEDSLIGLPGLGVSGKIITPFANYEIPIGIMYNPTVLDMKEPRRLGMMITETNGDPLKISMLGVSAAVDTDTFEVSGFIKILHNVDLE